MGRNDDLSLILTKAKLNGFLPDVKNEELDYLQGQANASISDDKSLNDAFVPKWQPSTVYSTGYAVLNPSGDVVTAITGFTSGSSYNSANWNLSASYSTPAQSFSNAIVAAIVLGA